MYLFIVYRFHVMPISRETFRQQFQCDLIDNTRYGFFYLLNIEYQTE